MPSKPKFTIQPVTRTEITGINREILAKTQDDGVHDLAMAKEIRLDRIRPDPAQPRRSFDQEALDELAASIREQGVLQPIVVQYVEEGAGGYFMLTHGERRWRAAQMAGLETIPAIIREPTDDATRLVRQLMENIQREDLNAVDRANALKALKAQLGGASWDEVGRRVGISKRRVLQLVATTELPPQIQDDIRAERIAEKDTRAYAGLPTEMQLEIHQARQDEGLSPQEVTEIARRVKGEPGFTIAQAISEVKERAARQDDTAREPSAVAAQGLGSGDLGSPGEPGFTNAEQTAATGPLRGAVCLASMAVREPVSIEADPLGALLQLEQLLDAAERSTVDTGSLQVLLEAVIAKASALLARLRAPLGSSDFNRSGLSPERLKSSLHGEPPTPIEDLT